MELQGVSIPQEVEQTFNKLQNKYSLEFENVTIRGKKLKILHIKDIEPLIAGNDIFANSLEFPFWVKIWEAEVILANLVATFPVEPGKQMLELGAGLGVAGMVAASFGHKVTITDYKDEILDFVRVSACINNCLSNIRLELLDWLKPKELGQFDTIIASEVLFHESFFVPLLDVFKKYLKPNGTIYMTHDIRRKSLAKFLPLCEKDYQIGVKKINLSTDDENYEILITRLLPK